MSNIRSRKRSSPHQDQRPSEVAKPRNLDADLFQDVRGRDRPAQDAGGDGDKPSGGAGDLGAVAGPGDGVRGARGRVATDRVGFLGEQVARRAEKCADGRGTECHCCVGVVVFFW